MQHLERIVRPQEQISPGKYPLIPREAEILVLGPERIQLMELFFAGQLARRLEMIDDGERHEHGPTPGRHLVDVKRRPLRQQDHFYRNGGQIFPRELAHECEIKLAESVDARDTAHAQNIGASLAHKWQIG